MEGDSRIIDATPVSDLLAGRGLERPSGTSPAVPTGFEPLDAVLGGGMKGGDLVLLGGAPGVGKTVAALQWARNAAKLGRQAVYACYEHRPRDLLLRLLSLELGTDPSIDSHTADKARTRLAECSDLGAIGDLAAADEAIHTAAGTVATYGERLLLVRGASAHTGLRELESVLPQTLDEPPVLFVDYLQKVAVRPEPTDEAEKVTRITEGLKDLAMSWDMPVVAVVAADRAGLAARRLRLHHLRGSSALAFESDVAIVLNEKVRAVSKVHLAYDPVGAELLREWIVFSVEKNRSGPNLLDIEFRKDFPNFRFVPTGGFVRERLVDERLEEDNA